MSTGTRALSPSWEPLRADNATALIARHADPLGALSRGEFPAIVLRQSVAPAAAHRIASLLTHTLHEGSPQQQPTDHHRQHALPDNSLSKLWYQPRMGRRGFQLLGRAITSWPALVASENATEVEAARRELDAAARLQDRLLAEHNLTEPREAVLSVLSALAGGRPAGPIPGSIRVPSGGYRANLPGDMFSLHCDTYTAEVRGRMGRRRNCSIAGHTQRLPPPGAFSAREWMDAVPEFRRRGVQGPSFSISVVLSAGDAGGDLTVTNAHYADLVDDCSIKWAPASAKFIVHHDDAKRLFSRGVRRHTLKLGAPGEVYIFNSHRAHQVNSVLGRRPRLTYGAFFDSTPSGIFSWT